MDGENVQTGAVPAEGTTSPAVQEPVEKQTQPSTEDQLKQLRLELEQAKRHFQSVSDRVVADKEREMAALRRRAKLAEEEASALRPTVAESDPQAAELARLRAREKVYSESEQEEIKQKQAKEANDAMNQRLLKKLADAGIDPNDSRVDWGGNTYDYYEGMERFHASVEAIKAEKVVAAALKKQSQQLKDAELQRRKELGLDSVDTGTGGATGNEFTGIPTKADDLGKWIGKMSMDDYEKVAPKIKEMRRRGLIT